MPKVIHTGTTNTTGGRDGASRTSDGRLDVKKLSSPGSSGPGANPEQLFAAAWSACFLGAIGRAAAERRLRVPADPPINAEIDLLSNDAGYVLQARLEDLRSGASIIASAPRLSYRPARPRCRLSSGSVERIFQRHQVETLCKFHWEQPSRSDGCLPSCC